MVAELPRLREFCYVYVPSITVMIDLLYIAITVIFFALSALFTRACDKLHREDIDD